MKTSLREEVEAQVKEELSARYEQSMNNLVEAMDNMLTDTVNKHAQQSFEEIKGLKQQRQDLTRTVKEVRKEYKDKMAAHTVAMESFVLSQLTDHVKALAEEKKVTEALQTKLAVKTQKVKEAYSAQAKARVEQLQSFVTAKLAEELSKIRSTEKSLQESKVVALKQLREHKMALNHQTAQRINNLERFVIEQLNKEVTEFKTDKDALVEMKVRLATESKVKLEETRKAFIERASKLVESTVESHLRKEMVQLKEDVRAARENVFGRRLFEAYQAEFMASYFGEGSQVKKLTKKLDEANAHLGKVTSLLESKDAQIAASQRKIAISEEKSNPRENTQRFATSFEQGQERGHGKPPRDCQN